jgi:hypothetical protein
MAFIHFSIGVCLSIICLYDTVYILDTNPCRLVFVIS